MPPVILEQAAAWCKQFIDFQINSFRKMHDLISYLIIVII